MSPMQMIRDEIKQLRIRTETIDLILRDTPSALLAIVDAYCRHMGIAESALGKMAAGDPNLIADIRNGRAASLRTVARLLDWMEKGLADGGGRRAG